MAVPPDATGALALERAVPEVSRDEILRRLGDPSLVLVDVLPRASWESQRIPGAISLPVDDIPSQARALLPDLDADIVLYCGRPT